MKSTKFMFALSVVATSASLLLSSCNLLNNEINDLGQNNNGNSGNQSGYVDKGIVFNPSKTYGTMTDNDGNVYKTITVGNQTWMAENLRTTHYRNGDQIATSSKITDWQMAGMDTMSTKANGLQCIYEDASTPGKWGRLYNWYAATDTRSIAPKGWHVPSNKEWRTLYDYANSHCSKPNDSQSAGGYLCCTKEWDASYGTDNGSGFTALPAGHKFPFMPKSPYQNLYNYANRGYETVYWSTVTVPLDSPLTFSIMDLKAYGVTGVYVSPEVADAAQEGYSIRLIKD
jgi:uncharacterized protein (TIGR02145 family)